MNILGISHLEPSSFGHYTSVAMLDDNTNLFAISEERVSRIKNDGGYPSNAIQFCLKQKNLRLDHIDKVAVGAGLEKQHIGEKVEEKFYSYAEYSEFRKTGMEEKNPIFYDHQYIHVRTGYALSGFKKALIICLDGGGVDNGEPNSGGMFLADDGDIRPIKYFPMNHSLGLTYGAITEICGFAMAEGEGKTMTLAPMIKNENMIDKEKIYEQNNSIEHIEKYLRSTEKFKKLSIELQIELEISELYYILLNRKPDLEGLSFFKNQLITENKSITWVKESIIDSDEYKSK